MQRNDAHNMITASHAISARWFAASPADDENRRCRRRRRRRCCMLMEPFRTRRIHRRLQLEMENSYKVEIAMKMNRLLGVVLCAAVNVCVNA